jgi:hypothetical protein
MVLSMGINMVLPMHMDQNCAGNVGNSIARMYRGIFDILLLDNTDTVGNPISIVARNLLAREYCLHIIGALRLE